MITPPYVKQEQKYTCSLAVLRMVLAANHKDISEQELIQKVEKEYGKRVRNILNKSIAELAKAYGLHVALYDTVEETKIKKLLVKGNLIQISIRLQKLYVDKKGLHSILLYAFENDMIYYHDPSYGKSLQYGFEDMMQATEKTGPMLAYK